MHHPFRSVRAFLRDRPLILDMAYGAASAAANAAVWAASASAWSAAWDAERVWQAQRLAELLGLTGD